MRENIKLPLYYGASTEIFRRAEKLRNNMTEAEEMLWNRVNYRQISGFRFRRQHPINQFIVDFYCHKAKLVIELDGGIHNKTEVQERDKGRQYMLENFGLEIMRFSYDRILKDIENVIMEIKQKLAEKFSSKPL